MNLTYILYMLEYSNKYKVFDKIVIRILGD